MSIIIEEVEETSRKMYLINFMETTIEPFFLYEGILFIAPRFYKGKISEYETICYNVKDMSYEPLEHGSLVTPVNIKNIQYIQQKI